MLCYLDKMDEETKRKLFENGAFAIFLDVPVGSEFGIDWQTWTTDTKFKGQGLKTFIMRKKL